MSSGVSSHDLLCSQGMRGDPGPKGLPQGIDVTHTGTHQHTLIRNTHRLLA